MPKRNRRISNAIGMSITCGPNKFRIASVKILSRRENKAVQAAFA
jgi:hypothetical protein